MIFVWTLGDVVTIAFFALLGIYLLCLWIPGAIKEARCKHDGGVSENRSCDAFCDKCGKNLGFIGALSANKERK